MPHLDYHVNGFQTSKLVKVDIPLMGSRCRSPVLTHVDNAQGLPDKGEAQGADPSPAI